MCMWASKVLESVLSCWGEGVEFVEAELKIPGEVGMPVEPTGGGCMLER